MSVLHLYKNLYAKLTGGSVRTAKLKKNVLLSLFVKAGSIICSLLLVPATIDFVNNVQYGIWLTISSIVAWMSFFDVGFTNGLRNKLAEAFGFGKVKLAKAYISTTYAALSIIFTVLMVLLLVVIRFTSMSSLLNIDVSYESDLKEALFVLVIYFCVTFVLKILSVILIADQRPAYSSFIDFVGQVLSLLFIIIVASSIEGSLSILSYCLCVPPLLVWIAFTFICFGKDYKNYIPSLKYVNFRYVNSLLTIGVKFFVIQIAAIIQFQTANFLIGRLFSMSEVTEYNIAYKYFNVLYMVFMILLQPFWSAVTEAYAKGDLDWIRNSIRKYLYILTLMFAGGLLMLAVSESVYDIWIGKSVSVSFVLSVWMFLYIFSLMFGAVFVYFVNGVGALRIQFISSLISPLLFVSIVMVMSQIMNLGVISVLIASIVANFNGLFLAPFQYYKIIVKNNKGIWSM